jgi:chitin disaccharide deacetylase
MSQTNRLLGYPEDARLLIVNADDLGMSASINEAALRAIAAGVARSTTLMTPWPGAAQAMGMLRQRPDVSFGVHLTVVCDSPDYRWGPVAPVEAVPSLVDDSGSFHHVDRFREIAQRVRLDDLEAEYRAQVDAVLAAGLRPTHLDWHCLSDGGRPDVLEMTVGLARELGLALRVCDRAWIDRLGSLGLPTQEHDLVDSYELDPDGKSARYVRMLRELPAGLSEWAVHPSLDGPDLRAVEPATWRVRTTDYEFLVSAEARETIEAEGIVLLSYEPLQRLWAAAGRPR